MLRALIRRITRFASRLKRPYLFALMLGLFVLNLLIPDPIPFADEMLLGLLTAFFAKRKPAASEPSAG
jgi:hypothetical protein